MTEAPAVTSPDSSGDDRLVPVWLAILVLALLIALAVLGGFLIREWTSGPPAESAVDLEIERWEEVVRTEPGAPENHLRLGFAYQQAERWEDALEQYDLVLGSDPTDTAALYNKGVVYLETMRLSRAEETLWDVLELEPTHALAAKRLGEYYASLEQYRSLIEAVRPAAEARPEMADLQYLMGLAQENLGQDGEARTHYETALEYAPDMTEAREGLARLGVGE